MDKRPNLKPKMTALRRCYRSCTGFGGGWISRWPAPWYTCHCPAWPQLSWPPTVSWSPTKVVSCALPTQGHHSVVRRTYSSCGDRCFAAAGPALWKSLPAHQRQTDINFEQFKRLLKTFLFRCWDHGALWLTAPLKLSNLLTYAYTLKYTLSCRPHTCIVHTQIHSQLSNESVFLTKYFFYYNAKNTKIVV